MVNGKYDLDKAEPVEMVIRYDPNTQMVTVDTDDQTSFAEMFGLLGFAQMLVMTDWQSQNAMTYEVEEYDDEEDFDDDEF